MKALVTGAKGMLGQDLCPILEDNGYEVIETDIEMLDITDELAVLRVLTEEEPDLVVHCAAYTNVDKAEEEFEKTELINVKGTENVAKACAKIGATLVYVSTDYVFDGEKETPYLPSDKPNPINNYGITKLHGEEAVKKYCKEYYIARTSWLYGHHGKNFVETMLELSEIKKEIKVVNDQYGCPTWTMDLANALIEILDEPCGIYHVCGGGKTTWYEFAREIFSQAEIEVCLKPCTTEDFSRLAKRPKYSVMDNDKICRNWKAALKDYMELRA